jgi:hypothetical protein
MVIAVKQVAAMILFLLAAKTFEKPLVSCLIGQFVGVEHCTPDTPEVFHGEHLPSEVGQTNFSMIPPSPHYTRYFLQNIVSGSAEETLRA